MSKLFPSVAKVFELSFSISPSSDSVQFSSVAQLCLTLCDPMDCSTPGFPAHHSMVNRWGNNENNERLYFGGAPKLLQMVTTAMKLKDAYSLEEKL